MGFEPTQKARKACMLAVKHQRDMEPRKRFELLLNDLESSVFPLDECGMVKERGIENYSN